MKRAVLPALMVMALMSGTGQAAEVAFKPARHLDWHRQIKTEAGENAILFREFMTIDWEQLAKRHFAAYDLDKLSKDQMKELGGTSFFGYMKIDFPAPLPEAYKERRFLLLSEDGSRELEVTALSGTARYQFDRQETSIARIVFYGDVIGVPRPNDVTSGGFVVMLPEGLELSEEEIVEEPVPQLKSVNPYPKTKIERQIRYRFAGAEASFLVVKYEADKACDYACCEFAYHLFREDPATGALTDLQFSRYSCDI